MQLYRVGGCIRDELMGKRTKDIDYAVELDDFEPKSTDKSEWVNEGFALMREYLQDEGFKIFLESPQYATIRAQFPDGVADSSGVKTADFVLCRKEGPYSDGRRPDWVTIGSLEDDLARRDLTVNALAQKVGYSDVIDLFGGLQDIETKTLRFVGDPQDRIREDALRIMRAVRFTVTKGFRMDEETRKAICSPTSVALLRMISEERRAAELDHMFAFSTMTTLDVLNNLPRPLVDSMFSGRVRLNATLKKEKRR